MNGEGDLAPNGTYDPENAETRHPRQAGRDKPRQAATSFGAQDLREVAAALGGLEPEDAAAFLSQIVSHLESM